MTSQRADFINLTFLHAFSFSLKHREKLKRISNSFRKKIVAEFALKIEDCCNEAELGCFTVSIVSKTEPKLYVFSSEIGKIY